MLVSVPYEIYPNFRNYVSFAFSQKGLHKISNEKNFPFGNGMPSIDVASVTATNVLLSPSKGPMPVLDTGVVM